MIVNMLEAVSDMLDIKGADEASISIARVECAKKMLDKIIEGMKNGGPTTVSQPIDTHTVQAKPQAKRKAEAGEIEIVVDNGRIKAIKNATDDTRIELDGVAYPWQKAIGKSFTDGRVL